MTALMSVFPGLWAATLARSAKKLGFQSGTATSDHRNVGRVCQPISGSQHYGYSSYLQDATLGLLAARLRRALIASEGAEHVCAFVLGDRVPHVHIHLVARYPGAPEEYWGVHVDEWPEAPRGGPQEIEALCIRLPVHSEAGK